MKRTLARSFSIFILAILAACNDRAVNFEQRFQLTSDLNDPGSVQFRNVKAGKSGSLCGEINVKNTAGGYIGFKRYIVVDATAIYIEGRTYFVATFPEDETAFLDAITAVQAQRSTNTSSGEELEQLASQRYFENKWRKFCDLTKG